VRHFRTDALPDGALLRLLALTHYAPSVGNSQAWRFVRVRSPGLRAALADHADAEVRRAGERYQGERLADYGRLKLHGLREAPEIVAVFCDEAPAAGAGLGAASMPEARRYSVVMAIHTLWLAARAEAIGLGWVSVIDPVWVTTQLDVPADWSLIALLCLGHPEVASDTPELEERGWQARLEGDDHVLVR
jgi:5,6-dimethylbenzimidazole synthase